LELDKAVAELEALVRTLESEGDERALHLLELVDAIHRPALELIAEGRADHPLAQALLAVYGLTEVDDAMLVEEALDEVRPYIHSHGGEVELVGVDEGVVRVRMTGSCDGCVASTATLKRGIEEALRANYPDFREVVAETPEGGGGGAAQLLQIEGVETARRPVFAAAGAEHEVPLGGLKAVEVDGVAVVLANVDGEIYAFRDACPVDGMTLHGGRLADAVLVCPWHNCAFDARSGQRLDEEGDGLAVAPVAVRDGEVQVAVNVA
jgi:Fe-S cluster biogenesis protein NfuA/nitrite reductase/ring-hydroxylating ferredoxin subunit